MNTIDTLFPEKLIRGAEYSSFRSITMKGEPSITYNNVGITGIEVNGISLTIIRDVDSYHVYPGMLMDTVLSIQLFKDDMSKKIVEQETMVLEPNIDWIEPTIHNPDEVENAMNNHSPPKPSFWKQTLGLK